MLSIPLFEVTLTILLSVLVLTRSFQLDDGTSLFAEGAAWIMVWLLTPLEARFDPQPCLHSIARDDSHPVPCEPRVSMTGVLAALREASCDGIRYTFTSGLAEWLNAQPREPTIVAIQDCLHMMFSSLENPGHGQNSRRTQ